MKQIILIVTLSFFELCNPASAADITQIHSRDGATNTPGSSSIEEGKSHANIAVVPDLRTNSGKLRSTVITPHVECTIVPGTNILWCSAFQYAWNELCDLAGGPITMVSQPSSVTILNKKAGEREDIDEMSCVAAAGLVDKGIYEKIRNEMKRKFNGKTDLHLNNSATPAGWVAYAYLFKELPFQWAFTRSHETLAFEGYYVDSFGIDQLLQCQEDEPKMVSQVSIFDYNNENDLIIELKTQAKEDRLILAKIPPAATLDKTIDLVERRITASEPAAMSELESLWVPVVNFDVLQEYSELCGKPICSTNKAIDGTSIIAAQQSIRFRLDERGAVLKSEVMMANALPIRDLIFDKPFLIMLKRKQSKNPYFALWVGNAELLVPTKKKPVRD